MNNPDPHKIHMILKTTPQRSKTQNKKTNSKYPQQTHPNHNHIYLRTDSLPSPNHQNHHQFTNQKQCLIRPSSYDDKKKQKFTQHCLSILSRKNNNRGVRQQSQMQAMMNRIVENYKQTHLESKLDILKSSEESPIINAKGQSGYSKFSAHQDRIQLYRMIKSSELINNSRNSSPKKVATVRNTLQDWKSKPDVTGIRMNNRILRSQPHDMQGVTCTSLPIAEVPMLKRHSMIIPHTATFQPPHTASTSYSNRRKVSINRQTSQKFMPIANNTGDTDTLYMKKLKSFLDFIFKVNFSNQMYISLQLSENNQNFKKYKVFIGKGNNSNLIKSLLKRRFWLQFVQNMDEQGINFYWTQNTVKKVHFLQKVSKNIKVINAKLDGVKRKQLKNSDEKQQIELNKKILSPEDSYKVEKLISNNGFILPFDNLYSCSIISNHIPRNTCIGSKKNLFKSMFYYYKDIVKTDPFQYIPKTYHVRGAEDPQFKKFMRDNEDKPNKVWIVKPGQNSNRGKGIKLSHMNKIGNLIKKSQKKQANQSKTFIIQSYINKPFLYNSRKFDIRHFLLLTSVNGILKGYWYKQGYIRTSSQKFDLNDLDNQVIHLTNDSIQKKYSSYEKYESGNKISYTEFQRYLDMNYLSKGYSFEKDVISKMKCIMTDVIKANYNSIDKFRRECNFEVYGFDFMLDRDFKPWLIQINFNPCLEMSCSLLNRIIPVMVQNSLRVGLDPLLPPPTHYPANKKYTLSDNYLKNLRYQLIFDESTFDQTIPDMFSPDDSDDEEEEYCDDGKEIEDLII